MKYISLLGVLLVTTSVLHAQEPKAVKKSAAEITIAVPTMQCGTCSGKISKALRAVDGVETAKVDQKTKLAVVTYNPSKTSLQKLEAAITATGYDANKRIRDMKAYDKLETCCKISAPKE